MPPTKKATVKKAATKAAPRPAKGQAVAPKRPPAVAKPKKARRPDGAGRS